MRAELEARTLAARDSAELLTGGAVNLVGTAVGVLRTLFVVLVARLVGEAALGTFALAWATVDLASKIGGLGLDLGITQHVARADADVRSGRATRGLLLTAVPLGLASSIGLAAIMLLVLQTMGYIVLDSRELVQAIGVMVLGLPGVVLYRICNGFSHGLRIMRHNVYSRGLVESVVTLLAFLAVFAVGARQLAPVGALVLGTTAGGGTAWWLAWRASRGPGRFTSSVARRLIRYSLPVAGYSLVNLLMQRFDVLLLGAFVGRAPGLDLATFGAYCAAVEIANVMRRVRQTFEPIYTPVVALRMAEDDVPAVRGIVAQMGRWILGLQLPVAGVLGISGALVLSVFGAGFVVAAPWLALLVIAHGVSNMAGLGESILLVKRPDLNLWNSSVGAIAQLAATLWLVPKFGAAGAPLAMIAAHTLLGTLRVVELRRLFALSWPCGSLVRPAVTAAVAVGAAFGVRAVVSGPSGGLSAAVVLITVDLAGWWVLGFDDGDRATVSELKKRARIRWPF